MRIDWDVLLEIDDDVVLRADVFRPVEERNIHKDRGFVYDVLGFGAQLDSDSFEVYSQMHYGFFKEEPRNLDPKTRELIENQ